jgi:hypothetical protein
MGAQVSKKLRFEVFKRDSFTCQYCGQKAPGVVLHVDHLKPRKSGGGSDILNLITSCVDCNLGKGARHLDDSTALAKQRAQLDLLQERREQLELMIEWQRSLIDVETEVADQFCELWNDLTPGFRLNASGRSRVKKMVDKFGAAMVGAAMRTASMKKLEVDSSGALTEESVNAAFNYIAGICRTEKRQEQDPFARQISYICGIAKNNFRYPQLSQVADKVGAALDAGVEYELLRHLAINNRNSNDFLDEVIRLIKAARSEAHAL